MVIPGVASKHPATEIRRYSLNHIIHRQARSLYSSRSLREPFRCRTSLTFDLKITSSISITQGSGLEGEKRKGKKYKKEKKAAGIINNYKNTKDDGMEIGSYTINKHTII